MDTEFGWGKKKTIVQSPQTVFITTDASLTGWGTYWDTSMVKANGTWSLNKKSYHIYAFEILAYSMGIRALCANVRRQHIRVMSDNATAVAYIQSTGGPTHYSVTVLHPISGLGALIEKYGYPAAIS